MIDIGAQLGVQSYCFRGLLETMQSVDFDGYVVLKYEGNVENPVPALTERVQAVRSL